MYYLTKDFRDTSVEFSALLCTFIYGAKIEAELLVKDSDYARSLGVGVSSIGVTYLFYQVFKAIVEEAQIVPDLKKYLFNPISTKLMYLIGAGVQIYFLVRLHLNNAPVNLDDPLLKNYLTFCYSVIFISFLHGFYIKITYDPNKLLFS